jgi:hypothetical protein
MRATLDAGAHRSAADAPRSPGRRGSGEGDAARPSGPVPTMGEHVWEVLNGLLGYDGDRIADLAAAEVLE